MATIAWYNWTAWAILALLTMGSLKIADVPVYYCDLEDKSLTCIFLKDNDKTCVEPLMVDGKWTWKGDRCQVGYEYGNWTLVGSIKDTINLEVGVCVDPIGDEVIYQDGFKTIASNPEFQTLKPTIHYNAKLIKKDDLCYAVGNCITPLSICE
ncbi:MAG: hypothetical protein ACTSQY_03290 [Candidatus Odinarchaeia archaeon]